MPRKSKCHQERRNSPSVASLRPISSCFLIIFSTSRSSTALSSAAVIAPCSRLARASLSAAGRKKLPTWSARNGALVLCIETAPWAIQREQRHGSQGVVNHKTTPNWPLSAWDRSHLAKHRHSPALMPGLAAAAGSDGGDAEIALQHRAIGGKVRARPLVDHGAALEDRRPVGDAQHLLRVLLHQDRGHDLVADDAPQRPQQFLDQDRSQPLQRLIQQHNARIEDQGAADREHLLFAARELVAEVAAALLQAREQLVDAPLGPSSRTRHGGEVLLDRERLEDIALLWHPADPGMGALVGAKRGDIAAIKRDRSADEARDADYRIDQGGLAHAVAAEQSQRLPFRQRERDLVEHDRLAVARAQPLDGQEVRHRATRPDRRP